MGKFCRHPRYAFASAVRTAVLAGILGVTAAAPAFARNYASPKPQGSGFFGRSVVALDDADGDRIGDFAAGSAEDAGVRARGAGRVYLFSGYQSRPFRILESPRAQDHGDFGRALAAVPDGAAGAPADGLGDILVGACGESEGFGPFMAGRAYLFSGGTGEVVREFAPPQDQYGGNFGWSLATLADQPPVPEEEGLPGGGQSVSWRIAIGAPSETPEDAPAAAGQVHLFDAATGAWIMTCVSPEPTLNGRFGFAIAGLGDVTDDGAADIAISAIGESATSDTAGAGRVHVMDGESGDVVYTLDSPTPLAQGAFGNCLAALSDVDGDGLNDLAVGAGLQNEGSVYVFSGADGSLILTLQSPNAQPGGMFGAAVASVADMDADGAPELIAGACGEACPAVPSGTQAADIPRAGRAYLFSGASGALLRTYQSTTPTSAGAFGYCVAGANDLDDDAWGDVVIGAPAERGPGAIGKAGTAFAFLGNLPQTVPPILIPPVVDQVTSHNVARYGISDYGPGVCYAAGYYYKTSQDARSRNWTARDLAQPRYARSPFFLERNGGAGHFAFAFELMKGHGACCLASFPDTESNTSDDMLAEAAEFAILDYRPFFNNRASVSPIGEFTRAYDNPTTALLRWIERENDGFVIGIPVFGSFETYAGGVYDAGDRPEPTLGFHALFVCGYDAATDAFRVVNSWGEQWGENGYGWLSARFVRTYAIEAWRMESAPAFTPNRRMVVKGRRQSVSTKRCVITYRPRGDGRLLIDAHGVSIAGEDTGGDLRIRLQAGVPSSEPIPLLVTSGPLRRLYTEAPIAALEVNGRLDSVTARRCWIGSVTGENIRRIRMSATPNATWQQMSHYLAGNPRDYYDQEEKWLDNHVDTTIADVWSGPDFEDDPPPNYSRRARTTIQLSGVRASDILTYWSPVIRISSKKQFRRGFGTCYSVGGILPDAIIEPDAEAALSISVRGGAIEAESISAGQIDRVAAAGMRISTRLDSLTGQRKTLDDYLAGNIRAGGIDSWGPLRQISAQGGNLIFSDIFSAHSIGRLSATHAKYYVRRLRRVEYAGGFLGDATEPGNVETTGDFWEDLAGHSPDIRSVFGSLGVAGVFNAADAAGRVHHIATLGYGRVPPQFYPPVITGEGWSRTRIRITGGDASTFIDHPPNN